MGHTHHKAIIVTSREPYATAAQLKAAEVGLPVIPSQESQVNRKRTFLIPPSGSMTGWDTDIKHNDGRKAFIEWLLTQTFSDGSSPYEWVEVNYGSDNANAGITQSRWHNTLGQERVPHIGSL